MGCACILKEKSIVAKDLDLIPEINKYITNEAKEGLEYNCKTKISEDISISTKKIKKCKKKSRSSKNLTFLKEIENKNKQNEAFISGPIITLLKKTVDDYKEKKNKSKKEKEKEKEKENNNIL